MNGKRWISFLLAIIMVTLFFAGCSTQQNEEVIPDGPTKLSDMSGKKVGIMTGSIQAITLPKLIPDAQFPEFNTQADMIAALMSGKVDAFSTDESIYKAMLWEGSQVSRIDEAVAISDYGMIFPKGQDLELQGKINAYLEKIKEDGTHKTLREKWFGDKEPDEFVSYDDLQATNGTLKIGVSAVSKPFVYMKNGKCAGFEVELIVGFCKEYGYNVEFEDTTFSGILTGVSAGKYTIGMSGITITDERKESVDFSDVSHTEDIVLVIRGKDTAQKTLADYRKASVGVTTGTYAATLVKDVFPEGTIQEFSTIADLTLALTQGKVDICMEDASMYTCMKWEGINIDRLDEPYEISNYGIAFQKDKNTEIREQLNAFIETIKENGEYDKLHEKWYGNKEPTEFADPDTLTGTNGTLKVVTCNEAKPFGYIKNGKQVGYDMDFIVAFAEAYGYRLEVDGLSFPAVLQGLQAGRYDLAISGLTITPERAETLDFTNPYHQEELIFVIYSEKENEQSGFEGFMQSLQESFEKTFIREQRWKLIVEGIQTTMIISFFSVIGGSLLGFALYMLARAKNKLISAITKGVAKVYTTIIAGTPTLVVLMLLFYLVFTSPDMSGVVVAIVGFSLTFGAFVYENLALTVSSVDNGQLEAAYALGYSRNRTFFRIILPQAMKMFIPNYSGEIISLIKATSVVGYIAVNDLTKMGDIIRGNTYEAFFPLIAVAVIYFAITWIIAGLLGVLKKKTEPKRRKNKNILRGVVR